MCNCRLSCRLCGACVHMYICSCMDATLHTTVCKHVHLVHMKTNSNYHQQQAAVTLMKAVEGNKETLNVLPKKRHYPANKNNDTQPKFFSTKQLKLSSTGLSKPSYQQKVVSKTTLLATDVRLCGICFQEDDNMDKDVVDCIQCSRCHVWLHQTCTISSTEYSGMREGEDNYVCPYCK